MITNSQIKQIHDLRDQGLSKQKVSKLLFLDRGSVRKYWEVEKDTNISGAISNLAILKNNVEGPLQSDYSYLLGMYLSDGYINKMPRTYKLRVFLGKYENTLIELVSNKLSTLLPNNKVNIYPQLHAKCTEVHVHSNLLPDIFPCVDSGEKHLSVIPFESWQLNIVKFYPKEFILGCLHGDGCRYLSRGYTMYNFSNMSSQIRTLFQEACLQIGITTRCYNNKIVAIYKQEYSKIIDSFWVSKSIGES